MSAPAILVEQAVESAARAIAITAGLTDREWDRLSPTHRELHRAEAEAAIDALGLSWMKGGNDDEWQLRGRWLSLAAASTDGGEGSDG